MIDLEIEALFKKIYKNLLWLAIPGVVTVTSLFFILYLLFFPTLSLSAFFLLVFYAKTSQHLVFSSDRNVSLIVGYDVLQRFFFARFEEKTKHIHLRSKILFYVGFSPWYRCRSSVLRKWHDKEKKEHDNK